MPHQRRKSGHGSATDLTKAKRPVLSRRHTPVNPQKLGKSQREREREREWQESWDNERESFPQFCMSCEQQFVPYDDRGIYCSEACRRTDQASSSRSTSRSAMPRSYAHVNSTSFYALDEPEPKDIIPQASPSRPTSMRLSNSPPVTPGTAASYQSSAISALRSLNLNARPPSPPSPLVGGMGGASHFWPFGGSSARSAATSPSTSYSRPPSLFLSSTYDGVHGGYYDATSGGMDRPLPSRNPAVHARHKSIELVTPMLGR